jgi:hypothetical protein
MIAGRNFWRLSFKIGSNWVVGWKKYLKQGVLGHKKVFSLIFVQFRSFSFIFDEKV